MVSRGAIVAAMMMLSMPETLLARGFLGREDDVALEHRIARSCIIKRDGLIYNDFNTN